MGLDSVELLWTFEQYFKIEISAHDSENIRSVQDMADTIAKYLKITKNDSSLIDELINSINQFCEELNIDKNNLNQKISDFLNPEDKQLLDSLASFLDLTIPKPYTHSFSIIKKAFHFRNWTPQYNLQDLTVNQFLIALCAKNYRSLVDPESVTNTFEIHLVVVGITSENLGLDIYEIQPEKEFVKDFGIN